MIQFIYLFCTSFISLFIYINYFDKSKKKSYINYIIYYFISVIFNFFIMNTFLYFVMHRYILDEDLLFSLKYILMSSIVSLHLPILFNVMEKIGNLLLKKYFNFYDTLILRVSLWLNGCKEKVIRIKFISIIINYYKNNKLDVKSNFRFIFLVSLLFWIFDIVLRCIIYYDIKFFQPVNFTSNILTLSYGLLVGCLLLLFPKKIRKVMSLFMYFGCLIIFSVNYMLINIKSEAFSMYNLQVVSEGVEFINFVLKEINFFFVCVLLISIIVFRSIYKMLDNIKFDIKIWKKIVAFVLLLGVFFSVRTVAIGILDNDDIDGWNDITYPKYYTYNFINSRKSFSVLGMYDYFFRDLGNYIRSINEKFGSVEEIESTINESTDVTKDNEMSKIFEGKNLIMIMMESIDNVYVNKDVMPTLTMMMNDGFNFTKRYSQLNSGGSTIATEYTTLTGLYYTYDNKYDVNTYNQAIPNMFRLNGYNVSSFHENKGVYYNRSQLHKSFGFENSYFLMDMNLSNYESYSDKQFFENDELYKLVVPKNSSEPFMSFIITISGHGPYDSSNGLCKTAGYSKSKDCIKYLFKKTDDMLASMIKRLEEDNLLDDTVIVLYSDHAAYSYSYTDEELKRTYENIDGDYGIKNLPFVIYNSKISGEEIDDIIVNDIDFAPTLFNMFDIEYDTKYYVGNDLFDDERINVCMFNDYTWYDGKIYSINAIKDDYYIEMSNYVKGRIEFSKMLVSNDYYKKVG